VKPEEEQREELGEKESQEYKPEVVLEDSILRKSMEVKARSSLMKLQQDI
jgi:hypothetical protein